MENAPASVGNSMCISRSSLLPPKIPVPAIGQSSVEHVPSSGYGSRLHEKDTCHRRSSSESLLVVDKPSWFDELLDEPETPVRKGVRQGSSSDSLSYVGKRRSTEKKDCSHGKSSPSEIDPRHQQQRFAQNARAKMRSSIAKLEKKVEAQEAENLEAFAYLKFMKEQKLSLDMENKAVKQRLESLAQKRHIQYLEHEALQLEAARLRELYQQQFRRFN